MEGVRQSEHAVGLAGRLLALLDHAYDAAEKPDALAALFVEADTFFFPRSAEKGVATDLREAGEASKLLDRHIARLQTLIDRAEIGMNGSARLSGGPQLATLVVSADGRRTVGNDVAADLLGCTFPKAIGDLGLTPQAVQRLDECLSQLRRGSFTRSQIVTLHHVDHDKTLLAKCTRLETRLPSGETRRGLSIVINHFAWRDDVLQGAAASFGLTPAELALLSCTLAGMSYPQAALALSKSPETLKAQGKSILRKVGVTQMSDVIRLMFDYAYFAERQDLPSRDSTVRHVIRNDCEIIPCPDGRQIGIRRYGKVGGRPLLFFHGLYQGPYLSAALNDSLARCGYEVFAPSRPGFDRTSPPARWTDFNATVTSDVLAVCRHHDLSQVDFVVHQAGISFACRAAGAMKERVGAAIMIAAGVPIEDHMLKTMNIEARVAGAAARYAPAVFDMLLRLGTAKWRRQGAFAYLSNLFEDGSPDRETLNDPVNGPVMENGVYHMISQDAQTIVADGKSAMSDWEPEYPNLPERQLWLHGAHDPVMNHRFVQAFLARWSQPPAIVYPDRGGDVLLGAADDVVERIQRFLDV